MSGNADLACQYAVPADLGGAGDAALRSHHRIVADLDIVGDLAEVVYLHAVADDGGFHFRAVDGGAGSDFHIVADDDIPEMLDLLPGAVWLRSVAKAVRADHRIGMNDDIVPDHHSRVDAHSRINDAVLADDGIVTDIDVLEDLRVVTDDGVVADIGMASEIYFLSKFGGKEPG